MDNILIVDDDVISREMLREILKDAYGIFEADSGAQAIELARDHANRVSAILLDILMPDINGFMVLKALKSFPETSDIPVILITRLDSDSSEIEGLENGAIDYITKPFIPKVILYRVGNQVELKKHRDRLQELVDEKANKLMKANETILDAVTSLIEYRNLESGCHVKRMRMYCQILIDSFNSRLGDRRAIDKHSADIIVRASALHDIGKVAIPDNILLKPGPLTKDEFSVMKTHTAIGSDFIDFLPVMEDYSYLSCAREICRSHHEHWDGSGYPDGIAGEKIPFSARIVAVADVYDALVSRRVYKLPIAHEDSVKIIQVEAGLQFDPVLVESFTEAQGQFRAAARDYSDG